MVKKDIITKAHWWTNFVFLLQATFVKRSVWITSTLFVLINIVFYVVLPFLTKKTTFYYSSDVILPVFQSFICLMIALCSATTVSSLFSDVNDDGTELILISKILPRKKYILTKILVYIFVSFLLTVINGLFLLICFCLFVPQNSTKYFFSFFLSSCLSFTIVFFFFGALAILVSTYAKRMKIILINSIFAIIIFVFQIVSSIVFKNSSSIMSDEDVSAKSYLHVNLQDGTTKKIVNFVPINQISDRETKFVPASSTSVLEYYRDICKKNNQIAEVFDIQSQFSYMTNAFGNINQYMNCTANLSFAQSKKHSYRLLEPVSPENPHSHDKIDFLYHGETNVVIPSTGDATMPASFSFLIGKTSENGRVYDPPLDQIIVAQILDQEKNMRIDIRYNKKYHDGFDELYRYLFDENILSCDTKKEFYEKQGNKYFLEIEDNLTKFYHLAAASLLGMADKLIEPKNSQKFRFLNNEKYFKITDHQDLNARYLQFKVYTFNRLMMEQKQYFSSPTDNEKKFLEIWKKSLSQLNENSWYFNTRWLPKNDYFNTELIIPDIFLMKLYWENNNTDATCTYLKYLQTTNLCKVLFVNGLTENYLFEEIKTDLTKPLTRSKRFQGKTLLFSSPWSPVLIAAKTNLKNYNHNACLWSYDVVEKVRSFVYLLIWLGISFALFALGHILHTANDIK